MPFRSISTSGMVAMYIPTVQETEHAISAEELSRILSAHSQRINAEISEFQLSPLVIYCSKTGQPIGDLKTQTLYTALEIHGREALKDLLYYGNGSSVHPAWVKTASNEQYNEVLDKLAEREPYAYAVYSLGFVTQQFYKLHNSRKFQTRDHATEFHWSLARAWQILSLMPRDKITELNDALCHLLVYAPSSLRYLQRILSDRAKTADNLARCVLAGNLTADINAAIEKTLKGVGETNNAISRNDFMDHARKLKAQYTSITTPTTRQTDFVETARDILREHYTTLTDAARGPSQFKKQRNAHKRILERELKLKLSKRAQQALSLENEFGRILFGSSSVPVPIQTSSTKIRWQTIENELADLPGSDIIAPELLASFDMENIPLPGEATFGDSDGAEMRTISWDILKARQAERDAAEKARLEEKLEAAPVTTFAERLARLMAKTETPPVINELPAFFNRFQK